MYLRMRSVGYVEPSRGPILSNRGVHQNFVSQSLMGSVSTSSISSRKSGHSRHHSTDDLFDEILALDTQSRVPSQEISQSVR
jgi:hypothetical protein